MQDIYVVLYKDYTALDAFGQSKFSAASTILSFISCPWTEASSSINSPSAWKRSL